MQGRSCRVVRGLIQPLTRSTCEGPRWQVSDRSALGHMRPQTCRSLNGAPMLRPRGVDSPARSAACPASLREMNSVKSRTRFVLRDSPCVSSQTVPSMCKSVPGTLTSMGAASPMKHGKVVIPSPCRTAAICVSPSVVLNGTPRREPHLRWPTPGFHARL